MPARERRPVVLEALPIDIRTQARLPGTGRRKGDVERDPAGLERPAAKREISTVSRGGFMDDVNDADE